MFSQRKTRSSTRSSALEADERRIDRASRCGAVIACDTHASSGRGDRRLASSGIAGDRAPGAETEGEQHPDDEHGDGGCH